MLNLTKCKLDFHIFQGNSGHCFEAGDGKGKGKGKRSEKGKETLGVANEGNNKTCIPPKKKLLPLHHRLCLKQLDVLCKHTGSRGRPATIIDREQLQLLREKGFTADEMGSQLGCSPSLIYKKLASENLQLRKKYSNIDESELDEAVRDLHARHHNAGVEVICT